MTNDRKRKPRIGTAPASDPYFDSAYFDARPDRRDLETEDRLVTVQEAATIIERSQDFVLDLVERGELAVAPANDDEVAIRAPSLARFLDARDGWTNPCSASGGCGRRVVGRDVNGWPWCSVHGEAAWGRSKRRGWTPLLGDG